MADTSTQTPRSLDHGSQPERFARGWHCLGLARDFADGKPHAVDAFGGKLVVWQQTDGTLAVIDAYCRHMGGDLTQGTVHGDVVGCPFHGWRWGADGRCKQIPYSPRVPLRARTKAYETALVNDSLLVWHDPEGSKADRNILPPQLPDIGTDLYTDWIWKTVPIDGSHCRELIDNVVDMAHFYYVHLAFPTSFRNVFEDHTATQYMESKGRPDASGGYGTPDMFLKSEATYYGPAYMINWLETTYKGFVTEVILINSHIPTGPNSFDLAYGITVKKPEGLDDATAQFIGKKYADMFG
ncbi:MAG: Rieske 2Fe-2S domain-containing protein, partial [Nocardioides sp.]|nr:Rieske 2Fe-2S domain-containing protein [Nocardioides sp.]